ncbi:hypothetical protein [Klebsiella oxytoca]|uniref:hypothetical protein n=1 Tax=Klebsiella oxytoca TaxID=571 RepID=UPI00157B9DE4|nr:hypothetical protein [Klebsiella oxytoca]
MKNKYCSLALAITAGIVVSIYAYTQIKPAFALTKEMSCQSRHTLIHDNLTLDVNYGFTFGNNQGELTIHGVATENNLHAQIRRIVNFSYAKNNGVYILHSQRLESLSGDESDESSVNAHFPAFFYETGKDTIVKIERDKFNTPVIYLHMMPVFYCKAFR